LERLQRHDGRREFRWRQCAALTRRVRAEVRMQRDRDRRRALLPEVRAALAEAARKR
jgi:hypothetical protein